MTTHKRRLLSSIVAVIVSLTILFPVFRFDTYAADVPRLDEIRVTLFIDSRGTVPAVTISASQTLSIGLRKADGIQNWITAPAGLPVRFAISDYALRVIDTADYQAAVAAYERVASLGEPALYAVPGSGRTSYQVRLGGYRSADEALAAKAKVPADIRTGMVGPDLTGPYFSSVGTYPSLDEAVNRQAALAQSGVTAYVAIQPNADGAIAYSLWIGEAASADSLEKAVSDAMAKQAGLSVQAVDLERPYLLKRTDAYLQGAGGNGIVRYQFNSRNQNVWLSTAEGDLKVAERFDRSYRGNIEVTAYNGKLAVINQLPFEQYLYSVIGSELSSAWPKEALKAQVVAARTFAIISGMKYKIAHISDTTFDQSYKGKGAEFPAGIEAVEATRSELLMDQAGLIVPSYSSNSGGMTADTSEAWKTPLAYMKSVTSPDEDAQKGKPIWYRIMLPDGSSGYISSDYAKLSDQKNEAGLPYIAVQGDNVNIRRAPFVDNATNAAVMQASYGQSFVTIGQEIESNAYNWIRGPYSADQLKSTINARSSKKVEGNLLSLEISERGPSDRVVAMKANGQELELPNPDTFRSALNGLPSTRFEVEETGRFTILGAAGVRREFPQASGPLSVISKQGSQQLGMNEFYLMSGAETVRAATIDPQFRFVGLGFGHGVGLSQYGAKALAEQGYDYQQILKYYYNGVSIVKG